MSWTPGPPPEAVGTIWLTIDGGRRGPYVVMGKVTGGFVSGQLDEPAEVRIYFSIPDLNHHEELGEPTPRPVLAWMPFERPRPYTGGK